MLSSNALTIIGVNMSQVSLTDKMIDNNDNISFNVVNISSDSKTVRFNFIIQ